MYVAPLVTYPACISAPPRAARTQLERLATAAFRTRGWAPSAVASSLGAVFRVRGAPRDLLAASRAGALRAFLNASAWGPPPSPSGPPAWLRALRQAALCEAPVEVFYCYRLTAKTKDPPYGNSHFLKTGFGPPFCPRAVQTV